MRTIKFREYRGDGKWHYWGLMDEGKFVGPCSPNSIAQQFTGVKDKNKNDIFEGDILKVENEYHHPDGRFIRPGHYMVEYFIDAFGLYRKNGWWSLSDFSILINDCNTDHAEVVGNINENRDLLLSINKW